MTPAQRIGLLSIMTAALATVIPAAAPVAVGVKTIGALAPFAAPAVKLTPALAEQIAVNAAAAKVANIPAEWRRPNWGRGGSCVHASLVNLMHWQGAHDLAEWWKANHSGGEYFEHVTAEMDRCGLLWAGTNKGDESFLQWACDTRRGCGVGVMPGRQPDGTPYAQHMVCLVGLDDTTASILDSNETGKISTIPRSNFLNTWHKSGGWAITPIVGTPPAPKPWFIRLRKKGE